MQSRRLRRLASHFATLQAAGAGTPHPERDSGGSMLPRMHSAAEDASDGPILTTADCAFFKKNGYLVKRKLIDPSELQICVEKFWACAPADIKRDDTSSWVDPERHASWATSAVPGFERREHNRSGYRWTAHVLGTDPKFLAATAHHPNALQVVEGLIGGPVKVPGRNRGIYAIFPVSERGPLGPHVDSHTFQCQMVTYLGPIGPDGGGFTMWPGSHRQVYYAQDQALNWTPNDDFPRVMAHMRATVQPVQLTGDIGDCVFTHHRVIHSAGSNCGGTIRMGVFSDYEKARPPAPICWRCVLASQSP